MSVSCKLITKGLMSMVTIMVLERANKLYNVNVLLCEVKTFNT